MKATWVAAAVEEAPHVYLSEWSAFVGAWSNEAAPLTTHLVGYRSATGKSRTSSAVLRYDSKARRAATASGRIYELVGPSNRQSLVSLIHLEWLQVNKARYVRDATGEFGEVDIVEPSGSG